MNCIAVFFRLAYLCQPLYSCISRTVLPGQQGKYPFQADEKKFVQIVRKFSHFIDKIYKKYVEIRRKIAWLANFLHAIVIAYVQAPICHIPVHSCALL
jgi:hypothetical protein